MVVFGDRFSLLLQSKRYNDVLQLIESQLQQQDRAVASPLLYFVQGEAFYRQENWLKASLSYEQALSESKKKELPMQVHVQIIQKQMISLFNLRMFDKALDLLTNERSMSLDNIQLSAQLALFYLMNERYQEAAGLLTFTVERSLKNRDALVEQFKEDLGQYKDLIDGPRSYETFLICMCNDLAVCESKMGNHLKALEHLQKAMQVAEEAEKVYSSAIVAGAQKCGTGDQTSVDGVAADDTSGKSQSEAKELVAECKSEQADESLIEPNIKIDGQPDNPETNNDSREVKKTGTRAKPKAKADEVNITAGETEVAEKIGPSIQYKYMIPPPHFLSNAAEDLVLIAKMKALTCYNTGKTELSLNKYDKAIECFKESIDYSPSFSRYMALGLTYIEVGNFNDAAEVITCALNMRSGISSICLGEVSYNLGVLIAEELKQPYKSLEFFDEATVWFTASDFPAGAILSKIAKASSLTAITAVDSGWEFLVAFLNTLYTDLCVFCTEQGYNLEKVSEKSTKECIRETKDATDNEKVSEKDSKNSGEKDSDNNGNSRSGSSSNSNSSSSSSSARRVPVVLSTDSMHVLSTENISFNISEFLTSQRHLIITRLYSMFRDEKHKYLAILYTNLGLIYYRLGISAYYQQARRCFETAIWFDSNCAYALNHFSILLLRENSRSLAIETLLKCTRIRPDYHEPFYNLGNILKAEGENQKALQYYSKSIELNPRFLDGYLARGTLYAEIHHFESAYHDFSKCIELNPSHNHAFCNYIHLKQILGIFTNDTIDIRRISQVVDEYMHDYKLARKSTDGNINIFNLPLPPIMPYHCYLYRLSISQLRFICQRYSEQNVAWVNQHMDMMAILPLDATLQQNVQQGAAWVAPAQQPLSPFQILMLPTQQQANLSLTNLSSLPNLPIIAAPVKTPINFPTIKPYTMEPYCSIQGTIFSYENAVITMPVATSKSMIKGQSTFEGITSLGTPLRIGILCDDVNSIPIGCLLDAWLCFMDENVASISIYSTVASDKSALRESIETRCKNFVDLTSQEYYGNPYLCAQRINSDGICVIICMCQHNYCLEGKILAMRPAPIQISYWAYGGTTGSTYLDYILADQYCIPLGYAHLYSEHVILMSDCFVCPSHSMHYAKAIFPEEHADILKLPVEEVSKLIRTTDSGSDDAAQASIKTNVLGFECSDASFSSTDSGVCSKVVVKAKGKGGGKGRQTSDEKRKLLELEQELAELAELIGVTKNEVTLDVGGEDKKLLLNDRIFIAGDNVFFIVKPIRNGRMLEGGDKSMLKKMAPLLKAVKQQIQSQTQSQPQQEAACGEVSVNANANTNANANANAETKDPKKLIEIKTALMATNCFQLELPLYRKNIRSLYGIPTDCFLFCTFSQVYKFDLSTLMIIISLLRRIPTAYYAILKFPPASQRYIATFFNCNAPDVLNRLLFLDMLPVKVEHIRRYLAVDVFVDTIKCNGSTIVLDALWAGVPVVSFAGDYILSRKTTSFVSNLECQDLVCSSYQKMVNICVRLATDNYYYMDVRRRILRNRYKLFDIRRWCKNFTITMALAYRNWLSGGKPISFSTERVIANMCVQGFSWPLKDMPAKNQ